MLRDSRNRIIAVAAVVAVAVWLSLAFSSQQLLEITFFDVGDGLCLLIYTPSGKSMVMDCGTQGRRGDFSVGQRIVAPYIQSLGLDSIDVAVLSHPHADHMNGFPGLLKSKPARLVLECGADYASAEHEEFVKAVKACKAKRRIVRRGQVLDMGDGVRAEILNPSPKIRYSDLNDNSIVMRVVYKKVMVMLTADAGEFAEKDMLDSGVNVKAQVLQVGHHGSKTATSPRWLAEVDPSVAVISCAKNSRYKFPAKKITERLDAYKVHTYVTGRCGAVTVSTDGSGFKVRTLRKPT